VKKAFTGKNSLEKTPIWLDDLHTRAVPIKVKCVTMETIYTIKVDISAYLLGKKKEDRTKEKVLKRIDKVIDKHIKDILLERYKDSEYDVTKAFSNLDENPIWLNQEKDICIKNVKTRGVLSAEAIHSKRDKFGNIITDKNGHSIPNDFILTDGNHHTAFYVDENGDIHDEVVSFYEAVIRANEGESIINKQYNSHLGWKFLFSMKQNEYFVFPNSKQGFDPKDINLNDPQYYSLISTNLYRVQSMSKKSYGNAIVRDYIFRHHLETSVTNNIKDITYKQFKSLGFVNQIVKVRVNHIGQIVAVGEY